MTRYLNIRLDSIAFYRIDYDRLFYEKFPKPDYDRARVEVIVI